MYGRKLREEREANLNRLKAELEAAKTKAVERLGRKLKFNLFILNKNNLIIIIC